MTISGSAAPTGPAQDVGQSAPLSADVQSDLQWLDDRVSRVDAASALVRAILACHPDDREGLLEAALEHMRAGQPVPPFISLPAQGAYWGDMASQSELRVHLVICFYRISPADQQAFLAMVQGKAAT